MEGQETLVKEHPDAADESPNKTATEGERHVQKQIKILASTLTRPDDQERQAAVQVIRDKCTPQVQSLVIDELLGMVRAGRKASGLAVASLTQLRPFPLPAFISALKRRLQPHIKIRLLLALGVFATSLDGQLRFRLRQDLLEMGVRVKDDRVRRAMANLIAQLGFGGLADKSPSGQAVARIPKGV